MSDSLGRVVFLHGIKTRRSNEKLRQLAEAFAREGFSVVIPYYGYVPAIFSGLVGWFDSLLAETLSPFIRDDDILVGYSNGAAIVYMISERVRIRGAVLINPALNPEVAPAAGFVHVYYNKGDWVCGLAGLLPFHLWGSMGRDGCSLLGVVNYDEAHPPEGLPPFTGHRGFFRGENLLVWSKFVAQQAMEASVAPISEESIV